jgi:hypothetical protein
MYISYLTEKTLFLGYQEYPVSAVYRNNLCFCESRIRDENHSSSGGTVTGFGLDSRGAAVRFLTDISDSSLLRASSKWQWPIQLHIEAATWT